MDIYLVGGAVRDELLGLAVKDRDWVVVGATPDDMRAAGYQQVGRDFPVFLHPDTHEEYALARTERKTGSGYTGFAVHAGTAVTLEEDLARRDLTVNAIARAADGSLVDPYGGADDLHNRVLRHVSPAFVEDPVRVLRAARFAARFAPLGFTVADETLDLMAGMVASGEVDALVPERVWQETATALAGAQPWVYFETLRECGALARVFPELDRLWGVPQPPQWHPEVDTGVHVMMVLQQAVRLSDALEVRFAALTHDLGKGTTPADTLPSHHGHEERSVEMIRALCKRLRVPNPCRDLAVLVGGEHGRIHRATQLKATSVLNLLERCDALRRPDRFEQVLLACEADARGRLGLEDRDYPQADLLRGALVAVRSVDMAALNLGAMPGPKARDTLRAARLGALKKKLRQNDQST